MITFWYNARTIALISIAFATMGATIALANLGWWVSKPVLLGLWLALMVGVAIGLGLAHRLRHTRPRPLGEGAIAPPVSITVSQQVGASSEVGSSNPPNYILRQAIEDLTQGAIAQEDGFCKFCQASSLDLAERPFDADLHRSNCLIPPARKLVELAARSAQKH